MGFELKATATYKPRGDLDQLIANRIAPGAVGAALACAKFVLQEAQAIVPIDTGFLRDSGAAWAEATATEAIGHVDFTAHYAGFVEFGTGIRGAASPGRGPYPYSPTWPGQVSQPFLRPAMDAARAAMLEIFRNQISLNLRLNL